MFLLKRCSSGYALALIASIFFTHSPACSAALEWQETAFAAACKRIKKVSGVDTQRCTDLPAAPIWLRIDKLTTMDVGLGNMPNFALNNADPTRGRWPMKWGGGTAQGVFQPKVAIITLAITGQMPPVDFQYVFLLKTQEGTSCVAGRVEPGPDQASQAQALAEKAVASQICETQPQLFQP